MHISEICLHYMYLRANGKKYRILSTNFPKLVPGNDSSDFMGFFGLGSGEFLTPRIKDLYRDITTVPIKGDVYTALTYWQNNPRFMGFVDRRPTEENAYAILDGGTEQLHDLPFNWEVFTQLGVADFARETLKTFGRAHVAYPTHEEHIARVNQFIQYTYLF